MSLMNIDAKIINEIFARPNPTTYRKDRTTPPGGIHPRCTRTVQHMQISQHHNHSNKGKGKKPILDMKANFQRYLHAFSLKKLFDMCCSQEKM